MNRVDISDISFEQLYIFMYAAKHRNFTKTAIDLNLTQSTISKKIASLEEILDVKLFTRSNHSIALTSAGEKFYGYTSQIIEMMNKGVGDVRNDFRENNNKISIAYCVSRNAYHIGAYFNIKHPELKIQYVQMGFHKMIDQLLNNELDFAFFGEAGANDRMIRSPLKYTQLTKLPLYVFVNDSNPISKMENINLEELKDYEFILHKFGEDPWADYIVELCKNAGFSPNVVESHEQLITNIMNLNSDKKVFICDQNPNVIPPEFDVKAVRIKDSSASSNIIWNTQGKNTEFLADLVEAGKEFWKSKNIIPN